MRTTIEFLKLIALNALLLWVAMPASAQATNDSVLEVKKASETIAIDGKADEKCWQQAESLSLKNYYKQKSKADLQGTKVKLLWDDENLYVYFECEDRFITAREMNRDGHPFYDDCAEIFLIPSPDRINMHFGFEHNLYKTVNDFVYLNDLYNDQDLVVKAYSPTISIACQIDGTMNDNSDIDKGWTMEMAIPLKSFHIVGQIQPIAAGVVWSVMAVRQDRNDAEGERVTTSTLYPLIGENASVHDPKSFGLIEFVE